MNKTKKITPVTIDKYLNIVYEKGKIKFNKRDKLVIETLILNNMKRGNIISNDIKYVCKNSNIHIGVAINNQEYYEIFNIIDLINEYGLQNVSPQKLQKNTQ